MLGIMNDIITQTMLQAFTLRCGTLRHISLLGSPNITDNGFKGIANNKKLAKIKIEGKLSSDLATFYEIKLENLPYTR